MCLIVMVGFPKSGKSTFVDLMFQQHTELGFKSMVVVRPSDWYPPNIEKLPAQERTEYQIAAWEHALEKVTGLLPSLATDDAVVLDTCGTSPNSLNTMIGVAKAKQLAREAENDIHMHFVAASGTASGMLACM